ncbi:MAG: hypothetical protein A2X86_15790 [Bdellovibrionales bacterium GWA2_49_15]|nr:MAG: hypothetical protein A2X86_15790 [Bdellovibrionales bacterium GWA2_49_15]HAZ12398.1 hypothetical protein [Bdellovibrionales bacterium]
MVLDKDKIAIPTLTVSKLAREQLNLMVIHDATLHDKVIRIEIAGKGCDGFTFEIGFTKPRPDDFLLEIPLEEARPIFVAIGPFTAFYLPEFTLDYKQGHLPEEEGFTIHSPAFKQHQGKFWLNATELVPPKK